MSESDNSFSTEILTIQKAAQKAGVEEHVLLFWTEEFEQYGFERGETLSEEEFRLALLIKRLLYEECFTLKGVKRRLEGYILPKNSENNISNTSDTATFTSELTENTSKNKISEKNNNSVQFLLDSIKKMDIISSEVQDIIELATSEDA